MKKFLSIFMGLTMAIAMGATVLATGANEVPKIGTITAGQNLISGVLGIVQVIGYAFAVGMLLYVGIKYTLSSANEKADLKKGSINYVIGAVIIFGASTLCGILQDLSSQVVQE